MKQSRLGSAAGNSNKIVSANHVGGTDGECLIAQQAGHPYEMYARNLFFFEMMSLNRSLFALVAQSANGKDYKVFMFGHESGEMVFRIREVMKQDV